MLEEKTHLPAVLQSLGCIAQTAMPVFETREGEIEEFIKTKILRCNNVSLVRYIVFLQLFSISDILIKFSCINLLCYFRMQMAVQMKVGMTKANFVC